MMITSNNGFIANGWIDGVKVMMIKPTIMKDYRSNTVWLWDNGVKTRMGMTVVEANTQEWALSCL